MSPLKWKIGIDSSFAALLLRLTFLLVPLFRNDGLCRVGANPDAKRLYDDLLSHYNRLIRPVSNNSQVVTVGLGLHLTQLIDLVCLRLDVI
jgi:Neurotransmitter-gated ion-channel ligand binding domain